MNQGSREYLTETATPSVVANCFLEPDAPILLFCRRKNNPRVNVLDGEGTLKGLR
jgi:hypothetical protein